MQPVEEKLKRAEEIAGRQNLDLVEAWQQLFHSTTNLPTMALLDRINAPEAKVPNLPTSTTTFGA